MVPWGGRINGNSVGLDQENRFCDAPSLYGWEIVTKMNSTTPKLVGCIPKLPYRTVEVKKPIFGTVGVSEREETEVLAVWTKKTAFFVAPVLS